MRIARPVLVNVVLVVVIVAALVAAVIFLTHPPTSAGNAAATTQLTSTVQKGVVSATINASGSIAPVREVSSSFAVAGTIATVAVKPGDIVPAGAVLGTLDTSGLSSVLAAAKVKLANANSQLADARVSLASATTASVQTAQSGPSQGGSSGQNTVSSAQSQVTSAQSQVTTAQDAVGTATVNLAAATLTAPIAGLVVAVSGAPGDGTPAGSPAEVVTPSGTVSTPSQGGSSAPSGFVTIADTTRLTVTANIAEADIASVIDGQAATVAFPALSDASTPATVTAIAPTASSSNSVVSYATTIVLDSVPQHLRLGQSAEVTITTRTSGANALYVPTAAITTANGASTVKVVAQDGSTSSVTVTLGVVGDVGTEITSGLRAGETVVIGTVSATQNSTNTNSPFGPGTRGGFGGGAGFGGGNSGRLRAP
ncbi:MAG: rane protein [Microbacteriaceae bacterium]|nr:rane protein [Microbacteriaceae bacterium]